MAEGQGAAEVMTIRPSIWWLTLGILGWVSIAAAEPQVVEVRSLGDHLEVDIHLEGEVELSSSSCLSRITAQSEQGITLSLLPRGFGTCIADLKVDNDKYRLEVSNPGEAGFNGIISGSYQFGPSGTSNYGTTLTLSGGVGDFHLNGWVALGSSNPLDARLRLRYQDTQLDWADNAGLVWHPAGSTGPGLYVSQDLWGFTLAGGLPLSAPARFGVALNTPNICFGGNANINLKDPMLWLSGGFEGFRVRVNYQPKRSYFLDYEGEYAAIPDLNLHFGGSEVAGYLEARGIATDPSLDWLKWLIKGTYDLSSGSPVLGSEGSFDTPDAHLGYIYSPSGTLVAGNYRFSIGQNLTELRLSGQYASAGPSFADMGTTWAWDENWGSLLGLRYGTQGLGGRIGMSYLDDLSGVFGANVGLEADSFNTLDSYRATLGLNLKGLEGWSLVAEVTRSLGSSGDTTAKIGVKEWFFAPTDPSPASAQWVDTTTSVAPVDGNYCWRWR